MLPWLNIRIDIVMVDLLQAVFGLAQRNQQSSLIGFIFVVAEVLKLFLVLSVLEDLLFFFLLGFVHRCPHHFLFDLLHDPVVIALHQHNKYIRL